MPDIRSLRSEGLLTLIIDNEPKRNAFTHTMTEKLGRLLQEGEADPAVRCIIITGAGETAFSSGHDLREMLAAPEHASDEALNAPFYMPSAMTTPTIAAINGFAFAAGFILAVNCDFRVAAENASFAAPGARIGLLPIGGQLARLPLLLPRGIAHELLVTCREMKAEEASRLGFVNRLAPKGGLLQVAEEMAKAITGNSGAVIREIKRGLEVLAAEGGEAATAFEWRVGRQLQDGPDAKEGITAFLEKRKARFQ